MNEILHTRTQIDESTKWLLDNGYRSHPISAKDWELSNVIKSITKINFPLLDMGADGSFVLHNLNKFENVRKVGIDLSEVTGDNKAEGVEYHIGDLMNTPFDDESFETLVCCSVLEHNVDYAKFASEVSRLMRDGAELFLSFDYWNEKINTEGMMLYGLPWNIVSKEGAEQLINELADRDVYLKDKHINLDDVQDKVINDTYCSPFAGIGYTFCFLHFYKKYTPKY